MAFEAWHLYTNGKIGIYDLEMDFLHLMKWVLGLCDRKERVVRSQISHSKRGHHAMQMNRFSTSIMNRRRQESLRFTVKTGHTRCHTIGNRGANYDSIIFGHILKDVAAIQRSTFLNL